MFKHTMDKLCEAEFAKLKERTDLLSEAVCKDIKNFEDILHQTSQSVADLATDLQHVEQKLDQLLNAQDPNRSIPNENKKPEPMGIMPGHIPWSQRKKARAVHSPEFIEKSIKSAATTEPKPETPQE